jgi:hypothetical protein
MNRIPSWREEHGYDCVPRSPTRRPAAALRCALLPTGQTETERERLWRALRLDREWQSP